MQVANLNVDIRLVGAGISVLILLIILLWPRKVANRRRPANDFTPLERRAQDVIDAVNDMTKAIETDGLGDQINPQWVMVKTASRYLERFLEEGQ